MNISGLRGRSLIAMLIAFIGVTALFGCGTAGSTFSPVANTAVAPTPSFRITLTPTSTGSGITYAGGVAHFTVTATSVAGFSTPVNLVLSGLPQFTTAALGVTTVTPTAEGATTTLAVTTEDNEGGTTALGLSTLTVTGTSGNLIAAGTGTLAVGGLQLSIVPASTGSGTVFQGGVASYILTLKSVNGFAPVCSFVPPALSPGEVAAFGASTLTPTAAGATTTFTITTVGPSGLNPTPTGTLDFDVDASGGGTNAYGTGVLVVSAAIIP